MSEQAVPGYAVVLSQRFGESRSLNMQFNFPVGMTAADMNVELDKLMAVFDRQATRVDIEQKRQELKAQSLMAEVIGDDIVRMEGQIAKIGEARPDPQRRNQVNTQQLKGNVEAQKEALKKTRRIVDELTKIVAEMEKKAA